MLMIVRRLLALGLLSGGLVLVGALTNSAAACGGADPTCTPPVVDGNTVTISVTGSLVRGGSDGSPGGGSATVSVPVPCYLTPMWTGKEYFDGIEDGTITGSGWDEWADRPWAPYEGYRQHKDDEQGQWWVPTCRMLDSFESFDEFNDFSLAYFLTYPATYVEVGEQPPVPPVPPEILLEAAQEVMEAPAPAFEFNPDAAGEYDTLVNFDTWFWLSEPEQTGSATATAGPNSVTVDGTLASVIFSSPTAGAVPCADTGVPWEPGATSDCVLSFTRAGAAEVTADTQWTLTWSYNGEPQGAVDPLSATFTQDLGVAESQALVTGVG